MKTKLTILMLSALAAIVSALPALAQWSNGSNLYPAPPIAIGSQAHGSIAFGVRCLVYTDPCNNLVGAGQRGISSEQIYNSQATTYVAGIHSELSFAPGSYTIPNVYRIRATEEPPLPTGVVLTNLYGMYIYDVNKGQSNWALYTNDGRVSFGGPVEMRGAAGTRSVQVLNGSILSVYDATGAEVGRIQGASGDMLFTAISGNVTVSGNFKVSGLAGSGTRAVYADSTGKLVAP